MRGRFPAWRTVGTFLLVLAFLVVLGTIVIAAFPQVVGADESYVVQSSSMSPAIGAGDLVMVNDVETDDIDNGDIITFRTGDEATTVTHRVVDISREDDITLFTTKGDANEEPDSEPVAAENVVGRVWFSVPLLGYVVAFAGSQMGLVALVVIPAVALIASEVWALYQSAESDDSEPSNPGDERT